jgi:hypothetical protein
MGYLLPTEYVQYGLTAETSDDWVTAASALMEAHCRRASLTQTQYVERLRVTAGAQTVRLSYLPLTAGESGSPLVSVRARYARPRRGELIDPFREEVLGVFGLPGAWTGLDVSTLDVDCASGELTLPVGVLGLVYNEVEATYLAGAVAVPVNLKVACAQIVKNAQATPGLNVKSSRLDTMQMEYFSGSLIDEQVQALLRPYVAARLG